MKTRFNLKAIFGLALAAMLICSCASDNEGVKNDEITPPQHEKTLSSISISTLPKTLYQGDNKTLSLTGMKVTAIYDAGTEKETSEDLKSSDYTTTIKKSGETKENSASNFTFPSDGDYILTVTYKGKTATTTIVYSAETLNLDSISVTPPTKTEYTAGENFNTEGMKVNATYKSSSNATKTVEVSGYTLKLEDNTALTNGSTLSTVGEKTVTVTFSEGLVTKSATFTITVKQSVGISVTISGSDDISITPSTSGDTITLTATVPASFTSPTYSWTSDDVAVTISGATTNICSITKSSIRDVCIVTLTVTSDGKTYKANATLKKN